VQLLSIANVTSGTLLSGQWFPRSFAAPRANAPIKIDGDIYKKAWEDVPWSQDFMEIRGDDSPVGDRPLPGNRTRVKMQWDDEYLYIAAEMRAHDGKIEAHFTERNDPIFQKDSDIEVFLDTDGSNTNYKELEVNARNTVWNLMLNKPYSAGGEEHSGRERKDGEPKYWDVQGQKTASKLYGNGAWITEGYGQAHSDGKWVCEIALSHKDSLAHTSGTAPAVGKFWRINFSRVEKKGALNWVWSPQKLWKPTQGKYVGEVNMHAPDAWGYVVFTEARQEAGPQKDWTDPAWRMKAVAHQLFYAERYAADPAGGGRLLSVEQLEQKGWIDAHLLEGLDAEVQQAADSWTVHVKDGSGCIARIRSDNHFTYQCVASFLGIRMSSPMNALRWTFAGVLVLALTAYMVRVRLCGKMTGPSD
jgi:hypothetical protein